MRKMKINIEELKRAADRAEIISFDIFGTLVVRRTSRPEDVFRLAEKITGVRGFAKKREIMQAECSRRLESTTGAPHCTFDELYEYLAKHAYSEETAQKLKKAELEAERDVIVPDKDMLGFFEYVKNAGKRIIAVSDMYFGAAELVPLLENCGYRGFDAVYSSADVKRTKYRGDMFEYVAEKEGVPPYKILHLGDDVKNDVENAKKYGFAALCIPRARGEEMPLYRSVAAGVSETLDGGFWYRLGARVGGPLYCGLITGMKRVLAKYRPKRVYFLSRDGYNLINIMKGHHGAGEFKYLYASRRSMLLCGITKLDKAAKRLLPPFTYGQSVRDILAYLDLGDISADTVKKAGFDSLESTIDTPDDMERFKRIYELASDSLFKEAEAERKYFADHLDSIGFSADNSIVFDCGWNGSSQYLLERALAAINGKKTPVRFVYTGIMLTRKSLIQLAGRKFDTLMFGMLKNRKLYLRLRRSIVLTELFFGAPENSLKRYTENGLEFEDTEGSLAYKKEISDGIRAFVSAALPIYEKYGIEPTAEDCLAEIFRLTEHPTEEEAVKIGDLENADGFAAKSGQKKYIAKLTAEDIKNDTNELYWPQGLYTRPDTKPEVREFVKRKTGVEMTEDVKRAPKRAGAVRRVLGYLRGYGPAVTAFLIKNKLKERAGRSTYDEFIENTEKDILKTGPLEYRPLFSFVVPVYNVEEKFLRECIGSVMAQTCDNWELILADDKSTDENVRRVLSEYEGNDKIKVIYRTENGHISRCTNTAAEAARGEYIVFMDCDDTVSPNAVYELTKAVSADRGLDLIYSDEDKLDENSRRHSPHFKPDWSPDTFMSLMFINHLTACRRSLFNELGGLRTGFEGAQDYDFALRLTERTDRIYHIPRVLYHWRETAGSVAGGLEAKPYVMQAMEKAKREALVRRGLKGDIVLVPKVSQYRAVYDAGDSLVSVIVPSKDNFEMLERCLGSLKQKTIYKNYELIVVDNGSSAENKTKYAELCRSIGAAYRYEPMQFNFAKMCNIGAGLAKGSLLLFLNDDTEIVDGTWLGIMAGQAALDHAGAVGAKLLYPNSTTIQHCGILNLAIGPCHALAPLEDEALHYFCRNSLDYNCLAVTAACLCVDRRKFDKVGGFDESFEVAYNDTDLCFKLYEAGYYNCMRTDAVLWHYESVSRGMDFADPKKQRRLNGEMERLYNKHPKLRGHDPFYNPNLAGNRTDFALAETACQKINGAGINAEKLLDGRVNAKLENIAVSDTIELSGWAYCENIPFNSLSKKSVLLADENGLALAVDTNTVLRFDISAANGKNGLALSGFSCRIDKNALAPGVYRVGILLENPLLPAKHALMFEEEIRI